MTLHWTYKDLKELGKDLGQGDILIPNEALSYLFSSIHPHFCDSKYSAFMILTQSCDLVQRKGKCKTEYINLAVIRPLQDILPMFLEPLCGTETPGIYYQDRKNDANQFLERLFNQNEQSAGLFYLHPDNDNVGIAQPSVALLRVSIAVRAHEHYQILLESRKGGLSADFQSKLGWLLGNIYSRIGTRDWDKAGLDSLLKESLPDEVFVWADKVTYKYALDKGFNFNGLTPAEISYHLNNFKPKPFKESLTDEVKISAKKLIDSRKILIRQAIDNHMRPGEGELAYADIDSLFEIITSLLDDIPDKLQNTLKNSNRIFAKAIDSSIK
jgi:hypothetical protein